MNFFTFMIAAVYVLYASRTLGLSAGRDRHHARRRRARRAARRARRAARSGVASGSGRRSCSAAVLFTAPLALLPFATGSTLVKAGILGSVEFVSGIGVMLFDIEPEQPDRAGGAAPTARAARRRFALLQLRHAPVRRAARRPARRRDRPAADAAGRRRSARCSSVVWLLASPIAGHARARAGARPVSRADLLRNGPLRALARRGGDLDDGQPDDVARAAVVRARHHRTRRRR